MRLHFLLFDAAFFIRNILNVLVVLFDNTYSHVEEIHASGAQFPANTGIISR